VRGRPYSNCLSFRSSASTYSQSASCETRPRDPGHHDLFKRKTKRTLPLGQLETFAYDLAGRQAGHTDFFIRKAIGWALRAYAWTDPKEVARYVAANESRLSGLSRREALKNIGILQR